MFNVGGGELLVILLVALIVLGPHRLPDAARQAGKIMGDLRRMSAGFQNELRSALETADDVTTPTSRRAPLERSSPTVAADAAVDPEVATAIAAATEQAEAVAQDPDKARDVDKSDITDIADAG
jgi:sec-independent protein translocase protein TatB